ncbi:MAG: hypothetical protein H8E21_04320 [Gammaproteobacteria bacterium]|nr:hypothetical protein [Gammaproteobacteria bacterium]MBL6998704.1 hypothetical protein [Gammaproteobacteria bacterium]
MKKTGLLLFLLGTILLNACATTPPSALAEEYKGPMASIQDTEIEIDKGKANFFFVSHIDGKQISNSRSETMGASLRQGNNLSKVLLVHQVPAQNHRLTIVGRTVYAMPIRALTGTVYEIKGEVEFSPQPDGRYIIKGMLSDEKSAVWIESIANGEIIKKVEAEGSTSLGYFEK